MEQIQWRRKGEPLPTNGIYADHVFEALTCLAGFGAHVDLVEATEQLFTDSGLSHILDGPNATQLLGPNVVAALEAVRQAAGEVENVSHGESQLAILRSSASRALELVRAAGAE